MKKFYKSKTLWIAVITFLIGGLTAVNGQLELGSIVALKAILDIVLRFLTEEPIS